MREALKVNEKIVSKSELAAKVFASCRQVEASGKSLIVTDHGKLVLELRPYRRTERNPLDVLRGSVIRYDNPMDPVADDEWHLAK
jgi:antitoxin (DNA-binding transcriptional repressor) of toxin-antitoxin stability system